MSNDEFIHEEEDQDKETGPSFPELFSRALRSKLYDVRTAMPAEVVKYDLKKQAVDVQPLLKRKYEDGSVLDMPVVYNVPVVFPRAGEAFIALPIKKGDGVLLIIADRSLDKWKSSGGKVNPEDTRSHNLSDAVAIPGLYPFQQSAKIPNANDLILKNKNSSIMMKSNGKISISNDKDELINLLKSISDTAASLAGKVNGGQKEAGDFLAISSQLGQFKA